MLNIIKTRFFRRNPARIRCRYLTALVLGVSLLSNSPCVLAQNTVHHKKAPTKLHTQKHHSHNKSKKKNKHLAKHRRSARHAQIRNEPREPQELAVPTEVSSAEPLNHDLAAVNTTHFFSKFPEHFNFVKQNLVNFVEKTVDNLHYSSYKLGGKRFDPEKGVYIVDCSNFVDKVLQNANPGAYSSLVNSVGADNPASQHYFNFFHDLSDEPDNHWNKINDVEKLEPGDILVFRYKNSRGAETGGHVMVVMDKPEQTSDVFFVRVADSAPSRHSKDTRQPHESGIGIGTLLLKANPLTGKPSAFAWGVNGYWNKNVKFAMARPVEMNV